MRRQAPRHIKLSMTERQYDVAGMAVRHFLNLPPDSVNIKTYREVETVARMLKPRKLYGQAVEGKCDTK